jgi:CRP-like cAMP-binding protein
MSDLLAVSGEASILKFARKINADSKVPWRDLAGRTPLGSQQNAGAWNQPLARGTERCYRPRCFIFSQGAPVSEVFLLRSGIVKLACTLPGGQTSRCALKTPGEWLEPSAPILAHSYRAGAMAITECRVISIETAVFLGILEKNNTAARLYIENQSADLQNAADALAEMRILSAGQRFQKLIGKMVRALHPFQCSGSVRLRLALTEEELAELIGVTPSYFSRTKRLFQDEGGLRWQSSKVIHISDIKAFSAGVEKINALLSDC